MESFKTSYDLGIKAESKVVQLYLEKGYKIVDTRYKTKYGETDIIASKGNLIVFIEVKYRKTINEYGEIIEHKQRKRLVNSALFFLSEFSEYQNYDIRFDLAILILKKDIVILENIDYN